MALFLALYPVDLVNQVCNNFIRSLCMEGGLDEFIAEHSLRLLFSRFKLMTF